MEIYRLTGLGEMLAHSIRPQVYNDRWRIIYYLARNGAKEKEDIIGSTGASSYALSYLVSKKVIMNTQGVQV